MPRKLLVLTALEMEAKALEPVVGPERIRLIGIRAVRLNAKLVHGADGLILAGLAGALDPALGIGEIILQKCGDWPDLPYRAGLIYTVDHLITSPQEKADLFRQTTALAVDMESAIVQKFAEKSGLPLLTLRSISDGASQALPAGMMNWIDDIGRPKLAKIAMAAMTQPSLMPALRRLERDSKQALASLADAVRAVIG
jgi:nucleoside phosphorylase